MEQPTNSHWLLQTEGVAIQSPSYTLAYVNRAGRRQVMLLTTVLHWWKVTGDIRLAVKAQEVN